MSSIFTLRCDTHEVDGPDLRRGAGGTSLQPVAEWRAAGDLALAALARVVPVDGDFVSTASAQWSAWLIEHEWCDIRLEHE